MISSRVSKTNSTFAPKIKPKQRRSQVAAPIQVTVEALVENILEVVEPTLKPVALAPPPLQVEDDNQNLLSSLLSFSYKSGATSSSHDQLKIQKLKNKANKIKNKSKAKKNNVAEIPDTPVVSPTTHAAPKLMLIDDSNSLIQNFNILDDDHIDDAPIPKKERVSWTEDSLYWLYEGLSYFGTDFSMIALLLECKAGLTIQSKQVKQRYQIENRSRFNKVTSALMDGRAPSQEIMDLMKALMKERRGENIVETVMPIMPEVFQEAASPSSTFVAPAKIVKPRQIVSKPTTLAAQIDKIATVSIPTPNLNIARKIDGKKFTINPKMFAKKRKIIE